MDRTDERPVAEKPLRGRSLPPGVYEDIPDYKEASLSATTSAIVAISGNKMIIEVPRDFSENAY
ncbi:unnamed protein product, partial [marine sediment metagenome]